MPYVKKSNFSRKSSTKKKPTFRKKVYKKRSAPTTTVVKRVVKNVLARTVETKYQTYDFTLTPLCLQATTGTLTNNYVVINPSNASGNSYLLGRGTDSGQMIGNHVRTKRAVINYVITLNNYNATTNPQMQPFYLRAYIYKYKKAPLNDPQVTNVCGFGVNANFFDNGTYDSGFSGTLDDLNQKLNKDAYIYLGHKTWKLGNAIPMVTSTPGAPIYTLSNNDFKFSAFGKWDVTKFFPKIVNRDDGTGTFMNDYVICLFQVIAANGTLYGNAVAPCTVAFQIKYDYTDA